MPTPQNSLPPPVTIELTDAPPPEAREAILAPLVAFNIAQAGPGEFRPLAILLRRPSGSPGEDAVVGGLWGRTGWG